VTTSYGVEGFTQEHLEAFKKHGAKRVLIAYDHDDAGDKAATALATKLMAEGLDCYRIQFPKAWTRTSTPWRYSPRRRVCDSPSRNAEWLGKGQRRAPTSSPACRDSACGAFSR